MRQGAWRPHPSGAARSDLRREDPARKPAARPSPSGRPGAAGSPAMLTRARAGRRTAVRTGPAWQPHDRCSGDSARRPRPGAAAAHHIRRAAEMADIVEQSCHDHDRSRTGALRSADTLQGMGQLGTGLSKIDLTRRARADRERGRRPSGAHRCNRAQRWETIGHTTSQLQAAPVIHRRRIPSSVFEVSGVRANPQRFEDASQRPGTGPAVAFLNHSTMA